jgi:hypothetical protein
MIALYFYFAGTLPAALVAAVVMIILGFFFAAVSGNLVGMIGSSNNPVSGLTLSPWCSRAADGFHRRVGHVRRGRRAGGGGGGVRLLRGGGRNAAGPEGGPHSRRHARTCRSATFWASGGQRGALFPLLWLHRANIKGGGVGFGDPKFRRRKPA